MSRSVAVAFDGITRLFGNNVALDGVGLHIESGETVALLGPNGAGKSTAIGIMLGLLDPTTGEARTLGVAPRAAVRAGRLGGMLQAATPPGGARVAQLVGRARCLHTP